MQKKWKTLSREVFKKTPWTIFMHDRFQMPDGGQGEYWYVHTNGSVFVVPVTDDGNVVVGLQYRYLVDRMCYEFPGGGILDDCQPLDAAIAELKEELGCRASDFKHVGEFVPYNGVSDEVCTVFLARGLRFEKQDLEETEQIQKAMFSFDEFDEMIRRGDVDDGMTLAAWQLARHHINK